MKKRTIFICIGAGIIFILLLAFFIVTEEKQQKKERIEKSQLHKDSLLDDKICNLPCGSSMSLGFEYNYLVERFNSLNKVEQNFHFGIHDYALFDAGREYQLLPKKDVDELFISFTYIGGCKRILLRKHCREIDTSKSSRETPFNL